MGQATGRPGMQDPHPWEEAPDLDGDPASQALGSCVNLPCHTRAQLLAPASSWRCRDDLRSLLGKHWAGSFPYPCSFLRVTLPHPTDSKTTHDVSPEPWTANSSSQGGHFFNWLWYLSLIAHRSVTEGTRDLTQKALTLSALAQNCKLWWGHLGLWLGSNSFAFTSGFYFHLGPQL